MSNPDPRGNTYMGEADEPSSYQRSGRGKYKGEGRGEEPSSAKRKALHIKMKSKKYTKEQGSKIRPGLMPN